MQRGVTPGVKLTIASETECIVTLVCLQARRRPLPQSEGMRVFFPVYAGQ